MFYQNPTKIILKGPTENISVLAQAKAWHYAGNKPLPEPVLNQIYVIAEPQWGNFD